MNDTEWVEDVRRWYFSGRGSASASAAAAPSSGAASEDADALGYEAADPVLQSRNWPDAALVSAALPTAS